MVCNIVFDLGGVLVDWNPRYLYRDVFKSEDEMEYFLQYVCSPEWNLRLDAGLSFQVAIPERCLEYPQYAREIQMYWERWPQMLKGEISPVVEIFRYFKSHSDYKTYALSNWSNQTFPIAEERFDFLKEFDGVILSGKEKVIKPDPEIFHRLLNQFQLKAEQCLFIDDNLDNVKSALDLNFLALHYHNPLSLKHQLRQLGVLGYA